MLRRQKSRVKRKIVCGLALFLMTSPVVKAEDESLQLQLTREAWAIDRDAFEEQLQSAEERIRDLSQRLSVQEQNIKAEMAAKVNSLDAQLNRVSKERNQFFLDNEKLRDNLAKSQEALSAVEALGANRQQENAELGKKSAMVQALSTRLSKLVEASQVRLQEIEKLRAENEQLRQEGVELRTVLATAQADKNAMMSALQGRLESLQARVNRLNQATDSSGNQLVSGGSQAGATRQSNELVGQGQPRTAASSVMTDQALAPGLMAKSTLSFPEWALAKALEYKLTLLFMLFVAISAAVGAYALQRRRQASQDIPLPPVDETDIDQVPTEVSMNPSRGVMPRDGGDLLDSAVESLVSKIHAVEPSLVDEQATDRSAELGDNNHSIGSESVPAVIIPPVYRAEARSDSIKLIDDQTDVGNSEQASTDLSRPTAVDPDPESGEISDDQESLGFDHALITPVDPEQQTVVNEIDPIQAIEVSVDDESSVIAPGVVDEETNESETATLHPDIRTDDIQDGPQRSEDGDSETDSGEQDATVAQSEQGGEGDTHAFRNQYVDTNVSAVIPRRRGKKDSLLVMDEFPTFGGYSKARQETPNDIERQKTHVDHEPSESDALIYGSSSYKDYDLSVSDAYLNPKTPALKLDDVANFGGYGLDDKKKVVRATQRRPQKRRRSVGRDSRTDRVLGFGSNISPLFDQIAVTEDPLDQNLQDTETQSFDSNSLMAHGGVVGDLKSPLVSIPLSLQKQTIYPTVVSEAKEPEVAHEQAFQADQVAPTFEAEIESDDHEASVTATLELAVHDPETTDEFSAEVLSDPLDAILAEPNQVFTAASAADAFDEQSPTFTPGNDDLTENESSEAVHDQSIDTLLSMAGYDLDGPLPGAPADDWTEETVDSLSAEPLDANYFNADSVESGSSTDFGFASPDTRSGSGENPALEDARLTAVDRLGSDEFGPSLSFGESSEPSPPISAEDSPAKEILPENVVHHPTSPGYTVPDETETHLGFQSGEKSSESSDPFDPFIRVMWLLETGDTKMARLEIEDLLLHDNSDVRRIAYDFKDRLAKNEAS